jgi:hypothetical protein
MKKPAASAGWAGKLFAASSAVGRELDIDVTRQDRVRFVEAGRFAARVLEKENAEAPRLAGRGDLGGEALKGRFAIGHGPDLFITARVLLAKPKGDANAMLMALSETLRKGGENSKARDRRGLWGSQNSL